MGPVVRDALHFHDWQLRVPSVEPADLGQRRHALGSWPGRRAPAPWRPRCDDTRPERQGGPDSQFRDGVERRAASAQPARPAKMALGPPSRTRDAIEQGVSALRALRCQQRSLHHLQPEGRLSGALAALGSKPAGRIRWAFWRKGLRLGARWCLGTRSGDGEAGLAPKTAILLASSLFSRDFEHLVPKIGDVALRGLGTSGSHRNRVGSSRN
jgi:hypothetical protein